MKALFDSIHPVLQSRGPWEQKQRLYYQMRHDGLRRRNKPFPTASDLHFPQIDMAVRKLKPFWMGQVMAGDRLAQFVSMQEQLDAYTDASADFFHYTLTQRTKFLRKLRVAVDTMLLRGRGILKITVDPFNDYEIVVEAVDPLFILMPDCASDFADADEFVQVRYLTRAQYQRDRRFVQEERVLARIVGQQSFEGFTAITDEKRTREGITHQSNPDRIILFEHYTRTAGGWTMNTYSPQDPDVPIRKPMGVPYRVNGKVSLPFFSFVFEVKDEGWYSPRGLGELLAPVELYLTKTWNFKADAMTFGNQPVFTSDGEIANATNIRWQPGEFIPKNVKAVAHPGVPFSFDQEMMFARNIGEQQAQSPDFGIQRTEGGQGGGARTATENERIGALQQAGNNENGQFFREDLGACYKHVWGIICQFKPKELAYHAAGKIAVLPEQALHDRYLIAPDGSPDGWNRLARFQKAAARLQLWKGDPNCDQDVLKRGVMAADDAQFALKAFIPTNQKGASEAEDEAVEINILKDGFPAAVMPGEDHATRVMVLLGWLQKQTVTGAALDPIARQRVQEHLALHWQYLEKTNPDAAKQLEQQIVQMSMGGGGVGSPGDQQQQMQEQGAMV